MQTVAFVVGVVTVLLTFLDFLLTTISLRQQGAITHAVAHCFRALLRRGPMSLRRYGGPITLCALAGTWIVLLWIGWTFVFVSATDELIGPDGASAVGFWDALALAGSTISTVGLGVVTPTAAWIHFAPVVAAVSGMLVLTLSVTYVLNVSQVATESRSTALQLKDLATTLDAARDDRERLGILLDRTHDLGTLLHGLADMREAFPLSQLYEVEDSCRDVAQRAEELEARIKAVLPTVIERRHRVECDILLGMLERLTR